jgi:hypothetical protein
MLIAIAVLSFLFFVFVGGIVFIVFAEMKAADESIGFDSDEYREAHGRVNENPDVLRLVMSKAEVK